jgi:hypothetical protein
MAIPRIIHQIWLGPKSIPWDWARTWQDAHPGWEYRLWTEDRIDFPLACLRQYLASPRWAGKADILRYEILKRFGGIYLDIDSVNLRPLDESLLERDFLAAYENEVARPGWIATGVLGCPAGHPVINDLVMSISRMHPEMVRSDPWGSAGPFAFTRSAAKHGLRGILPSRLFYPFHHTGRYCTEAEFREAYAVQFWGSTGADLRPVLARFRQPWPGAPTAYSGTREVPPLAAIMNSRLDLDPSCAIREKRNALLVDRDGALAHRLSETAELILRLFIGGARVSDVVEHLCAAFPGERARLRSDIYDAVCTLIEHGILATVPADHPNRPVGSGADQPEKSGRN